MSAGKQAAVIEQPYETEAQRLAHEETARRAAGWETEAQRLAFEEARARFAESPMSQRAKEIAEHQQEELRHIKTHEDLILRRCGYPGCHHQTLLLGERERKLFADHVFRTHGLTVREE